MRLQEAEERAGQVQKWNSGVGDMRRRGNTGEKERGRRGDRNRRNTIIQKYRIGER